MSSTNSTVSPELQHYMRCTACKRRVSEHAPGKCLYQPTALAPLAHNNFCCDTFKSIDSELSADLLGRKEDEQLYVKLHNELIALCPHPPNRVSTGEYGLKFCTCCNSVI